MITLDRQAVIRKLLGYQEYGFLLMWSEEYPNEYPPLSVINNARITAREIITVN